MHAVAQQTEPAIHGNSYNKITIGCRLHSGATVSNVGQGSRCTFLYKYEPIERGEDPVKVTIANLVRSCPDGVRKARFRALGLGLGQNYTRLKIFAAELSYGLQSQDRPGEVKPAPENMAAVDAANPLTTSSSSAQVDKAREPKPVAMETPLHKPEPTTVTRDKHAQLVAADAAETENPSTSSAPKVGKASDSASAEPGTSMATVAAPTTVGASPSRADPTPPPHAAVTLPPPVPVSEVGLSLPAPAAAALAARQPALSPGTPLADRREPRSSEDPPPFSVQPVTENEPARKRARLAPPAGCTSGVSDEDAALFEMMAATRTTSGAGSSPGSLQAHRETNLTSVNHSPNIADTQRQRDPQPGTSDAFSDGISKPAREAPLSQGLPLVSNRPFPRNAVQVPQQRQQQVMQPPPPPSPPSMTALLAAHGFDAQQRPAVELALREIGIRSIRDLTTFVLLEDDRRGNGAPSGYL